MKKTFITLLLVIGVLGACTAEGIAESAANTDNTNGTQGGTSQQTPTSEKYDFVITPKNVTGDFRTFFQNVVSKHSNVLIKDGTYEIELVDGFGVFPKDGCTITFEKNAKIKVKPNRLEVYSVIDLRGKKNITLINPNIEGDKYTHLGTTGQWAYGINVANCSNIVIRNAFITKMWGDGMNLRNCNNIRIYNPHLPDNRRQGISIESGNDIEIHDVIAENTGGQNPGYGIDIEPSWNGESIVGLRIYRPIVRNNGNGTYYTGGISMSTHMTHILKAGENNLVNCFFEVEIFDPVFEGDALIISAPSDYVRGFIKVHNPTFYNSKNVALYLHNHQSDFFKTEIINPKFVDCVQNQKQSIYLSPILFVCDQLSVKTNGTKNISIKNPVIEASNKATYKSAAIRNITPNSFKEDMKDVAINDLLVKGYEIPFYNYSGALHSISNLYPNFLLTFSKESTLTNLSANSFVSKSLKDSAINYVGETVSTIYLNDDILVSNFEFYYVNNSKNKSSLKLLFGTKNQPTKVFISRWSTKQMSGIEIPYGGFIKMKKSRVDSQGIQHWTVVEASNSVKGIN